MIALARQLDSAQLSLSATTPPPRRLVAPSSASTQGTARCPRGAIASEPTHVAVEGGQVWFSTLDTVWRLDPAVGTPVKVEAVGYVHDLAALDGKVYVARDGEKLLEGFVVPYDAVNGTRADGVSILACSLTASPALGLWAAGCPNVQQLGIEPNRITKGLLVVLPFLQPTTAGNARECLCAMTTGAGSVWVAGDDGGPTGLPHRPGRHAHRDRAPSGRSAGHRVRGRLGVGQRAPRRRRPADRPRDEPRGRPRPVGRAPAGLAAGAERSLGRAPRRPPRVRIDPDVDVSSRPWTSTAPERDRDRRRPALGDERCGLGASSRPWPQLVALLGRGAAPTRTCSRRRPARVQRPPRGVARLGPGRGVAPAPRARGHRTGEQVTGSAGGRESS